jgi:hypothetical protein
MKGVPMGALQKVEKTAIEKSRQNIIAATLSEPANELFLKKGAVRQLIGTLIAARARGLSFEKLAELMAEGGIEIATETLRAYFFEMKTEAELSAENAEHARKIANLRKEFGSEALAEDLEHAENVAANRAIRLAAVRPRVDAFADDGLPARPPGPLRAPPKLVRPRPKAAPHPGPQASAPSVPSVERHETASGVSSDTGTTKTDRQAVQQSASVVPPGLSAATPSLVEPGQTHGEVRTIDMIEADSAGKDKSELDEDLHLTESQHVVGASGRPFMGFLSTKQIFLLRTVGKLVAPTKGRSSKDFVPMPSRL